MAICLGKTPAPFDIELPHGVIVTVRPLRTAIQQTALFFATNAVKRLTESVDDVEAAGGETDGLPDLATEEGRAGYAQEMYMTALAQAAIIEWRGVLDEDGNPLPVTDEAVAELMRHDGFADSFLSQYAREAMMRISEGNASRPLPTGTMAKAPDIAKSAETSEAPVPVADGA